MKEKMLKKYIDSLTKKDIKDFAEKNFINLDNGQIDFIFKEIKFNYKELLYKNPNNTFNNLKKIVDYNTYIKIIDLYYFYKNKYQFFL